MSRVVRAVLAAASALALGGCTYATSSVAGNTTVSGEAWYVRTTAVLFIPVGNSVFYCPPPTAGPVTCTEAVMHDGDEASAPVAAPAQPPPPAPAPTTR